MDEGRILHVRAIGREVSKQELMIYFQSPKQSGGGDISSVELKEGEAVIIFEESDVAQSVVRRVPHTINGTRVEVSYQTSTEEFQSGNRSVDKTRTVIVRGLPQGSPEDTVLNYFENSRRSKGGAVEEVKIEGNVARVKFESSEVAHSVVEYDQHILNGATLDVSLELLDNPGKASKTIQVTGLTAQSTEDSIRNYFENERRSGGGEVQAVTFRREENVAFVTFKDVDVAKKVIGRTHTLNGTKVEVSLHAITEAFQAKEMSENQTRVVLVRGLPQNVAEDTVLNYFENSRRSRGGAVEEVKIKCNIARVQFESSEVAQRVVEHNQHILNGATLDVSLELLDIAEIKTIQVTGLTAQSSEDSIRNYFENERRSGGGEVETVNFRPEKEVALVTFKDVEAATKVIGRTHTLDGKKVEVSLHTITDEFQAEVESGYQTSVVFVRGLPENVAEDTVLNYFENSRRSGGGAVEEVQIEGNVARVRFESFEVAQRVVERNQHILNGATLDVSLELLDMAENTSKTIQVTGLTAQSSEDSIRNYFENERRSGGGEVEAVSFRTDENVAFVTFKDIDAAKKVIGRTHTLDGTKVEVSLHAITEEFQAENVSGNQTCVVIVRGLPQNIAEDTILNYFENSRRSGGGAVEEVKIKGNIARVRFESSEVAESVVEYDQHILNGVTLDVSLELLDYPENTNKTIQVTGLTSQSSEDSIRNYFENERRSGGGEVEAVTLQPEENVAFVTFKDVDIPKKVIGRTHILDGTKVEVSLHAIIDEFQAEVESGNQTRVVFVRGLPQNVVEDTILNYFENSRRSGGGAVEEVKIEGNIARVRFESSEVAQSVVEHCQHILNGATLDVSLELLDIAENTSKTIQVTGLTAQSSEDSIRNYFGSEKRSGGREIEAVTFRREENVAFVTFKDVDAAKDVLRRGNHILEGATLLVKPNNTATDSNDMGGIQESRTIEVTGLAAKTTKDAILEYFENQGCSWRGEVEDIIHTPDRGIAVITFQSAETTKSILRQGKHTLHGATLNVTARSTAVKPRNNGVSEESRTIEVTGISAKTTREAILNFFENKRSGGGEVESVYHNSDQGTAVITFTTAESARGVINKGSLTYEGANLMVTLKQPPRELPVDTKRLLVKGLSDKTTKDAFQSYMEVVSEVGVLTVEFADEACALVTFSEAYDYQALTKKISVKPLEGKILEVQQLPVCQCVQVTGFNKKKTTEDAVRYYFESPRNNGGEVSSVEFNIKEGWALVYFTDPKVVHNVLAKSHSLNGTHLDIRPYYSFLGKPQPDRGEVDLVQDVTVDAMKMKFIFEHCAADFTEVQNRHGVQITWKEGSNSVTVTPRDESSDDKYSFDEACEAVASFVGEFVKSSISVHPEAWQTVLANFEKSRRPAKDKLEVYCIPEQHVILLIGRKQEIEFAADELEGIKDEIEKKQKTEAAKETKTLDNISHKQLQFLKHLEFGKELESLYEEIDVNILLQKGKIQIRGHPDTIHKVCATIWETVAKMKDIRFYASQNVLTVLRSKAFQPFVKGQFTANNLQALVAFDENDPNVVIVGMTADVAQKAYDLVKELIVEESINLAEDQVELEQSGKWRSSKEEIIRKRILTLAFDRSNKRICLVGEKGDVSFAVGAVKRFLQENTIVRSIVRIPNGRRRFLVKYREQELRQIQEDLKEYSTRIKRMADENEEDLIVSGTTLGVEKAKKLIQDLASKVQSQKIAVSKPGMRKTLDRSKGKKLLGMLENENKCVIQYSIPQKDEAREGSEEKKAKRKKESLSDLTSPEGKKIMVFHDSICNRNVDVIVNAADSKLQHLGGVSKAICEEAGEAFREECDQYVLEEGPILDGQVAVTSAGKLPFQKVIHAVGPKWDDEAERVKSMGKVPRVEKMLGYTVKNALLAAKDYKSVALPVIGIGMYGRFPRELCAQITMKAVREFCEENSSCLLTDIQFTSTNDAMAKALVKMMDSTLLGDPNYESSSGPEKKEKIRKEKIKGASVSSLSSVSIDDDANVLKTAEGLQLVLITGDMCCEKVDVIVNSTSNGLDLNRNASAKALSAAAGPQLQQECKKIGRVETGEIVVTSGANLPCKHVFHTASAEWKGGKGEQVLREIIKKCLEEANKRSLLSISIPAIGTGSLGFPRDRVAAVSFDEVFAFSAKNPSSTLKEVHLVVYDKDLESVQAFQTELRNKSHTIPPTPQPPAKTVPPKDGKKKRRGWRGGGSKNSDADVATYVDVSVGEGPMTPGSSQPEMTIGNLMVQAEAGNITDEVTDAIATLTNTRLDLGGGVGKAILTAGGQNIQAECSAMGNQRLGSVVVSGAGKLKTKKIYHMVVVNDHNMLMFSIGECILGCLRRAESDGLTSIAFPAVGTGSLKRDPKAAAEVMMNAIFKFAEEQPTSIALIRIVIYQPHILPVFHTAMVESLSSAGGGTGLISKFAGFFKRKKSGSESQHSMPSMRIFYGRGKPVRYLEIFASTKQDIDAVVKKIEKDVADHCTQKVIEREAICNLSGERTQEIMKLETGYDVVVNIEQTIGRISVKGDAEDVLEVAGTIYEILNQKIEEEHARGVGELLSKNVQWYFYDDDETPEPYEPSINLQIEEAYREKRDSVIVLIEEAKCKIVFKDMKETCLEDEEERVVVRKEIGKGVPLPLEWDMQPKDGSGKEKVVHLVPLDSNASEYKKVADEVLKTTSVTIIKIERVQNPGLYRAYIVRKEQMEHKNSSNEKLLFHGTAGDSCPGISQFGFNRSYCGKNATAFGNGVYFARDASYSTQTKYSPPDATGNRYMYLARVLAGEYTKGRSGMITPPPKGSDATDAYDTVVNDPTDPTIFVVFYDNQCCPDYLITFK